MRTAQAERGLRGYYSPVCVIVAPEGIYVGRVCPPGPVGSMLLVWTAWIMASGAARRGAVRWLPFGERTPAGGPVCTSAAGCTRTHVRITDLSWLAVNGGKSSSWLLVLYYYVFFQNGRVQNVL